MTLITKIELLVFTKIYLQRDEMLGEISQITAHLSNNTEDFFIGGFQFCQLLRWPWQCLFKKLTSIDELSKNTASSYKLFKYFSPVCP